MAKTIVPFSPPSISKEELAAAQRVLKSGWLTMGNEVLQFEKEFANYIGCKYAIAVDSCTSALKIALCAQGIKAGDEIITTPFSFCATANSILELGAIPVFADIDPLSLTLDPYQVFLKITKRTKAIMPVHYGGYPADLDNLREYKIPIIEDAAHAIGTVYNGEKIGKNGTACFSFYPSKNMTSIEGGMITTNNKSFAEKCKILRVHGRTRGKTEWYYDMTELGFKANMTDLEAAIGREQLKKVDSFNKRRAQIAAIYREKLQAYPMISYGNNHLYPILVPSKKREIFIRKLENLGVKTSFHYPPIHLFSYYKKKFGYKKGDFPITEQFAENLISLPIYPNMTNKQVNYVVECVNKVLKC